MSVSRIMEDSDKRVQQLEKLLGEIHADEDEITAKLSAAISVASFLTDDFFFAIDITGKIILCTNSSVLGYKRDEVEGKHITFLIPEGERRSRWETWLGEIIASPDKRKVGTYIATFLAKDGSLVRLIVNILDLEVLGTRVLVGTLKLPESAITEAAIDKVADKVIDRLAERDDAGPTHKQ